MIQFRKATQADATDIIRIGRRVFSTTFGHSVPASELDAYLESAYTVPLISEELNDAAKEIMVAVQQSGPIGTTSQKCTGSDASCDGRRDLETVAGFAQLTRGSSATEPCVASLAHAASSVELQRLYVDTPYHGKGIGSRLAAAMEDIARQEGFTHMWLGVWEENDVAARVYAKLGYKGIGFHDFAVGSIIQRDDILIKEL